MSEGCCFIWTSSAHPTRRCVTHEYDWRPPFEPMCPGTTTSPPPNPSTNEGEQHG